MQLYERIVSEKGRVSYREYFLPHEGPCLPAEGFDLAEVITWSVALAMTQLMILRKSLPEHARVPRKIKAVEEAIYDLAKEHGKPLDDEMVDYVVGCWNRTMEEIQRGLVPV
jgi:hypothetical protein